MEPAPPSAASLSMLDEAGLDPTVYGRSGQQEEVEVAAPMLGTPLPADEVAKNPDVSSTTVQATECRT